MKCISPVTKEEVTLYHIVDCRCKSQTGVLGKMWV